MCLQAALRENGLLQPNRPAASSGPTPTSDGTSDDTTGGTSNDTSGVPSQIKMGLTDSEFQELLDGVDTDHDGAISFTEFCAMMLTAEAPARGSKARRELLLRLTAQVPGVGTEGSTPPPTATPQQQPELTELTAVEEVGSLCAHGSSAHGDDEGEEGALEAEGAKGTERTKGTERASPNSVLGMLADRDSGKSNHSEITEADTAM